MASHCRPPLASGPPPTTVTMLSRTSVKENHHSSSICISNPAQHQRRPRPRRRLLHDLPFSISCILHTGPSIGVRARPVTKKRSCAMSLRQVRPTPVQEAWIGRKKPAAESEALNEKVLERWSRLMCRLRPSAPLRVSSLRIDQDDIGIVPRVVEGIRSVRSFVGRSRPRARGQRHRPVGRLSLHQPPPSNVRRRQPARAPAPATYRVSAGL